MNPKQYNATKLIWIFSCIILSSAENHLEQGVVSSATKSDEGISKNLRMLKGKKEKKEKKRSKKRSKKNDKKRSEKDKNRFNIELINMGDNNDFDELFEKAAAKWERFITNDVRDIPAQPDEKFDWFDGNFGPDKEVNKEIDDMLFGYEVAELDGEGGFSVAAGITFAEKVRIGDPNKDAVSARTISGGATVDIADLQLLSKNDAYLLILVVIGFVLGVGPFFEDLCATKCIQGDESSNYDYTCPIAQAKYDEIFPGEMLQVEDDPQFRECGSWDEESFPCDTASKLMAGGLEFNKKQLITAVSLGALEDLGYYKIDYSEADPFICDESSIQMGDDSDALVVESEHLSDLIGKIERFEPKFINPY